MKKLIILSTGLFLLFNCVAQSKARSYEEYMQKSYKRSVAAWIFPGSGAAMTAGGAACLFAGSMMAVTIITHRMATGVLEKLLAVLLLFLAAWL